MRASAWTLLLLFAAWCAGLAFPALLPHRALAAPGEIPDIGISISKDAYWYEPEWTMRLSVILDNREAQPVEGVSVRLRIHTRNTSRSDLDDCLEGKPRRSYRLTRTFLRDVVLQPGANSFTIEMPLSDYSFQDGVYPLTVEAVGRSEVLASAISQLVMMRNPGPEDSRPLNLALVMDLSGPFHRNPEGVFKDRALARECDPDGTDPGWLASVQAQAERWENLHLTLSLSPALLEELVLVSGGYTVRERGGAVKVPESSDECRNAADVVDGFRLMAQQPRFQFLPVPYASPNMETLWNLGWYADVKEQLSKGRDILEDVLEGPLAGEYFAPPGLDLNSEVIEGLGSRIGGFLLLGPGLLERTREGRKLLADGATPGSPVPVAGSEGRRSTAVFADGRLEALVSKISPSEDPHGVTQYLVSELANLYLEKPSGERLCPLAWPGTWRPSRAVMGEVLRALSTAPWLRSVTLSEGIFHVPADRDVTLQIPRAASDTTAAYFARVGGARSLLGVFGGLVFSDNLLLPVLERNLHYAESDVWRQWNRGRDGLEYATAVETGVNGELAKLTMPAMADITLTSGRAHVPVTVINGTGYRVKADLYCESNGLEFPGGARTPVTLVPKENVFEIKVDVKKQGRLRFSALLQSGDMTVGRVDTTVRTGRISTFAVAFIGGLLGLIVLLWVTRVLARRKAGRHKKGQPGKAEG